MKKALFALCILAIIVLACGGNISENNPNPAGSRDNPPQEFQYRLYLQTLDKNLRVWCKDINSETRTGTDCRIYLTTNIWDYETRSSITIGANDSWSKR